MAKRSNPFTEDFVPQSKVHIGVKQFNNNEDRLQKVYEKTLELLFKGAKKQPEERSDITNSVPACKDKMKQLIIGKDGTLLHSGTMVASITALQCVCGGESDSACYYCDKALCARCRRLCSSCDSNYCTHCAFVGSEGAEVCVSCYC